MYFNDKNATNDNEKKNFSVKKIIIIVLVFLFLLIGFLVFFLNKNSTKYTLTLNGDKDMLIYQDSVYEDPGYKAYDSKGNDLSLSVMVTGNVDSSIVGEYTIVYTFNELTEKRHVSVISNVSHQTYLTLKGASTIFLKLGEEYVEPGYVVIDNLESGLSEKVVISGEQPKNIPGTYKLKYSVTNNSGLTVSAERTIIVMDSEIEISYTPQERTNGKVIIKINVIDNYFSYIMLPNGSKSEERAVSYEVSENGEYKFIVYNTSNESKESVIKIDNIFKNPPSGTCVANMYDDKTLINVEAKSDANITEYTYIVDGSINSNGLLNSYTSKKILPKEVSVKVVDEVNNSTVIKCDRKDNRKVNKYTPGITLHKTKNNLEYFLYLPESYLGTREKIPVIVYLHGSGMHTKSGEVGGLLEDVKVRGRKVDAIVLGPNADMDKKYPNASLYYGWRDRSADVVEMVDEVVSAYNGDVNRIYIAGGSVGAQGAFDILLKHPTVFRGIAVCNGPNYLRGFGSDDVAYKRLIDILSQNKIAVYLFRASGDQNVRSDGGYEIKYAIKKFGYPESEYKLNYDITVKGENTHRQAYLAFSESDYVDWLLQHK